MRMSTAIMISSIGLIGMMSLNEEDVEVAKGPRISRSTVISVQQARLQQSRARIDALREALLRQQTRLRARSANGDIVLPA
ncbi:hypothetical protein [Rhizobium binxianense]